MTNFAFNGLGHDEAERLALLAEECAEVIQVVGKILRHGYNSHHPGTPNVTNRQLLERELGDLMTAEALMTGIGDIDTNNILSHSKSKMIRVGQFLHHNAISPKV